MRLFPGRWLVASFCFFVVFSACHDLTLPPPPGVGPPGLLSGRVVWQRPGRVLLEPARGASVFILGTNLAATTNDDGRFVLDGLLNGEGELLIRFDADGDGVRERQRALSLRELGAGRGRQLSLGELVLGRNAVVAGRVQLVDAMDAGHAGTPVFVPGLPLATVTASDGAFVLEGLPEGTGQLAAVRSRYEAYLSGSLSLRGGEELTLARVTLALERQQVSGVLRGRVVDEAGEPLAGVTASLGAGRTTSTDGAGVWRFMGLPVDRYDVSFSSAGRLPAALFNVLVAGPDEVVTLDVMLARGQATGTTPSLVNEVAAELDGGSPGLDAGVDGGADGGGVGPMDGGVMVSIGAPIPLQVGVGATVGVAALVTPQQPATYQWASSSPSVMVSNPTAQNTGVVGLSPGPFDLSLTVTIGGVVYDAAKVTGVVTAAVDAGAQTPLFISDAGISPLAIWLECDGPFVQTVPVTVKVDGTTVPATVAYNGANGRLVAVFDEPHPSSTVTIEAASLQLTDGGLRSLPVHTELSQALALPSSTVLLINATDDFAAGAAYTPDGLMAVGRYFGGPCVTGCFKVFVQGVLETSRADLSPTVPTAWRRANAAGFTRLGWASLSSAYVATMPGDTWSALLAPPPGPVFVDGPLLRAVSTMGNQLQLSTFSNSMWMPMTDDIGSFANGLGQRRSSAVSTPGVGLFALAIDDMGNVTVRQKNGAAWLNLGGPNATGALSGRIAATKDGVVVFVETGSGASLHMRPNGGSWSQLPMTSTPLDLVGRGGRAWLVSAASVGARLELTSIALDGGMTVVAVPTSGPVASAELAQGDFGELGIVWSSQEAGSTFALQTSELQ